ncbi:MAG: hypothetical protein GXO79_09590 [Chlorobi bacterium]|nr:hypothetical protein [Chlorobiota bacterium]
MKNALLISFSIILFSSFSFAQNKNNLPEPESFFGFKPGSDGNLFHYEKLIAYFSQLDNASPMVHMEQIGNSPMGKPMYIVFISNANNISKLEDFKKINRELALNPVLSKKEKQELIQQGKVFVLATLSMHSNEVGPAQAFPTIAYNLITSEDKELQNALNNVVYMVVPCHNPDGMDMIVDHFYKYKGTMFDGASMPDVYHKYVGHDNNRDFITLSQDDTKAISAITSQTWFPQVMVEKHQMGSTGVRYFVPPNHDPIAENIDARLWNWLGVFGTNMANDMTSQGLEGVAQHYLFDNYWPGSTETCLWKNVIAFLTEAASANYANPVYVEPTELGVYGKGLSEYKKSVNMTMPWTGGWWQLSDIVNYEISSTFSILKTAARYKEKILTVRNNLCVTEVNAGKNEAPYYYVFPKEQHDISELYKLLNLLKEHGVHVFEAENEISYNQKTINKGDYIVPLAQPFRAFIKESLEKQEYPARHYTPNGSLIKPYDITSWSLPLHMGVQYFDLSDKYVDISDAIKPYNYSSDVKTINNIEDGVKYIALTSNSNESYNIVFHLLNNGIPVNRIPEEIQINNTLLPKGSFVVVLNEKSKNFIQNNNILNNYNYLPVSNLTIKQEAIKVPEIGLFETHFHDMDAGWTRYVFDSYGIKYTVIHPEDFEKLDLTKFNIIIFPNSNKSVILEGKYKKADGQYSPTHYPPEFTKGIGKDGVKKIMEFVNKGGEIISWGSSTGLFTGLMSEEYKKGETLEYELPFKNISKNMQKKGLYCPGSLVKVELDNNLPIAYGMPDEINVFYRGNPVFKTSLPYFDMDRKVIAKFPEKGILTSGYIEKEELLGNKAAAISIDKGKGKLYLFAFNPQFRASTHNSFKLIFNALFFPAP